MYDLRLLDPMEAGTQIDRRISSQDEFRPGKMCRAVVDNCRPQTEAANAADSYLGVT